MYIDGAGMPQLSQDLESQEAYQKFLVRLSAGVAGRLPGWLRPFLSQARLYALLTAVMEELAQRTRA